MSAFMDALQSCTRLSGPYSCSNGPLRSSSLRAEKAVRPSGRPVVEGEHALSWTRCAFIHMTRAIKEQRSRCFSLSVSSAFSFAPSPLSPPPSLPTSKREKGANCLLWEPKIIELPSFFLLCLFLLFFFQAPPKERDSVRETRGKSLGIFLRNANVREPKSPDSDRRRFCAWQQQRDSLRVHLKFL